MCSACSGARFSSLHPSEHLYRCARRHCRGHVTASRLYANRGYEDRSANVLRLPALLVNDPTAMQSLSDVHDTPLRAVCVAPAGLGVGWIDQLVPSQPSANALGLMLPTTVQAVLEVHDTPLKELEAPNKKGVVWIAQLLPFQPSATPSVSPLKSKTESPTTTHAVADTHDTPQSQSSSEPGVGVGWVDHLPPSQRSANVANWPFGPGPYPTATQAVADAHDTALRPLGPSSGVGWSDHLDPFHRATVVPTPKKETSPSVKGPPPTAVHAFSDVHDTPLAFMPSGVGCLDHFEPFQRSTNASCWPALLLNDPTAMQNLSEVHDTLTSSLNVEPAGEGVCWIDHFEPFQPSANGTVLLLTDWSPTAVQAFADVHDTPLSAPLPGDGTIAQVAAVTGPASSRPNANVTDTPSAQRRHAHRQCHRHIRAIPPRGPQSLPAERHHQLGAQPPSCRGMDSSLTVTDLSAC